MKLLNTIQEIIQEAEDNHYNATLTNDNSTEIEELERKVDESLNLLEIYKNLF